MSRARELADLGSSTDAGGITGRNLIINGAMQVAQRSTSATSITAAGYHALDRWYTNISGLGTWTISQSSDAPDGFAFSQKYDCTIADASPAASDYLICDYRIEAQDLQHLNYGSSSAKKLTLSFYVKSNKTGTYIAELKHGDVSSSLNQQSYTINSADTWEKKTLTYVGQTTDAINSDNGIGLYVFFWLGAGSNYTSGTLTQDTWADTTTANRTVGQVNLADSTSNEWHITGVQLEVGEQATPFEHRSYGDELARCQRYFYQHGEAVNFYPYGPAIALGADLLRIIFQHPVEMRAAPTQSATNVTNIQTEGNNIDSITTDITSTKTIMLNINNTSHGFSNRQAIRMYDGGSGDTRIKFDAEL